MSRKIIGLSKRNWKCLIVGFIVGCLTVFCAMACKAGVPVKFTVETSRADVQEVPCYHGETLDFDVTFKNYGKDLLMPTNETASIFWQTNGMSAFFWRTNNVTVVSNKMYSTFSPEMDPGTGSCFGFIGIPKVNYRASFVLRFKNSPGTEPKSLEWPYRELDFNTIEVKNAPYYNKAETEGLIDEKVQGGTGEVARVLRAEIATATPGNYETVSNKAMKAIGSETASEIASGVTSNVVTREYLSSIGVSGETNLPRIVMGNLEIKADLTARIPSGVYSDQWEPSVVTNGNHRWIFAGWTEYGFDEHCWWCMLYINDTYEDMYKMQGDRTNPEATTLTFPNGTQIKRVPVTKTTRLATTNDLAGIGLQTNSLILSEGVVETKEGSIVTATNVGAYSAANGNALASQVATIGAHLNAEDARLVSTNYNSETKMPEAYVEVKQKNQTTGSNEWLRVWSEMTRWNKFVGTDFDWTSWSGFHTWSTNIAVQIAQSSPKEYAFYDGVTGEVAPDGFFWIAQPRIAVCAGMSYQRYIDAGGAVWILESNGMVANMNGTTNGYFRISDEEGNSQFEIIKGDKQTVGATAHSLRSEMVMGIEHRFVEYAVTNALAAPTAKFCRNLSSPTWIADTEANCPCNVNWTSGMNSYTLEFWPKETETRLFIKAEYERGGETRIKNSVPTEIQYIILNNTKYQLVPKTVGGELVMGLIAE